MEAAGSLTEATESLLFRILGSGSVASSLEKELEQRARKYTGGSKTKAKVTAGPERLEIRLWLDMGEDGSQSEAEELTGILLGSNAKVAPHKMDPKVWVAVAWLVSAKN